MKTWMGFPRITGPAACACLALAAALLAPHGLRAQAPPPGEGATLPAVPGDVIALNFPNGIRLAEFVSASERYAKKRFLFQDASIKDKTIFIYGQAPIAKEHFFTIFQTVLTMNKLTLTPVPNPSGSGEPLAFKIVQIQEATQHYSDVYGRETLVNLPFDERWVSGVFKLKYISPNDITPTLMSFLSNPKAVIPLPQANMILVNDNGLNVKRVEQILKYMDVKGADIKMVVKKLKWAIATSLEPQLSRIVQTIMRTRTRPPAPGGAAASETLEIVADQRTNSLIVVAEENRVPEILNMIDNLDTGEVPAQTRSIHIYRLKNTNAGALSDILNRVYQGILGSQYGRSPYGGYPGSYYPGGGYPGGYSPYTPAYTGGVSGSYPGYNPYSYGSFGGSYGMYGGMPGGDYPPTIVPDEQNNSIIVASDYYKFMELSKIIEKLDIRRPQVLLEVAFVEVTGDNTLDLGAELATIGRPGPDPRGFAATNFSLTRVTLDAAGNVTRLPVPNEGVLAGVFKDQISNIPAMLYTLEREGKLDVLQVPTTVTSDNARAELTVGDERATATFTTTQAGQDVRSFRGYEKAGITLKITPHISEERYLRLETEVTVGDFGEGGDALLPPPKTNRELRVTVSVPNAHTIVLGGLVKSKDTESVRGVPLLMDIPGLGYVFSRHVTIKERKTLYIFITPHVFSDEEFMDYKRASQARQSEIERLSGRWVGLKTPEDGIPQYVPPFELQDPLGAKREPDRETAPKRD